MSLRGDKPLILAHLYAVSASSHQENDKRIAEQKDEMALRAALSFDHPEK